MNVKYFEFKVGLKYGRNSGVTNCLSFKNRYKVIGIKYDKFGGL